MHQNILLPTISITWGNSANAVFINILLSKAISTVIGCLILKSEFKVIPKPSEPGKGFESFLIAFALFDGVAELIKAYTELREKHELRKPVDDLHWEWNIT